MEECEGPADYAIRNGLTIDYRTPIAPLLADDPVLSAAAEPVHDDAALPRCYFRNIIPETGTIRVTSQAVAQLIYDSIHPYRDEHIQDLVAKVAIPVDRKKFKLDPPVFRDDHQLSLRRLSDTIQEFSALDLRQHGLPLEPVDVEADEGLALPQRAKNLAEDLMNPRASKIVWTKSFTEYLSHIVSWKWTNGDQAKLWDDIVRYRGVSMHLPRALVILYRALY